MDNLQKQLTELDQSSKDAERLAALDKDASDASSCQLEVTEMNEKKLTVKIIPVSFFRVQFNPSPAHQWWVCSQVYRLKITYLITTRHQFGEIFFFPLFTWNTYMYNQSKQSEQSCYISIRKQINCQIQCHAGLLVLILFAVKICSLRFKINFEIESISDYFLTLR